MNKDRALFVIFAALLALMLINPISITQLSISDTDPSTYIIVPMLMLPIFALFMLKKNITSAADGRSAAFGIALLATFVLLSTYMQVNYYYTFFSYRIDMLAFPIAILGVAAALFGIRKLGEFTFIALYAVFASPLLLLPLMSLNQAFTNVNSIVVYHIASLLLPNLAYSAPTTLVLNGSSIGIGQSCVGVGALIGIVMFLIPLAYFYDGKPNDKAMWVFSGFVLLLALNLIRMTSIALLWFTYGPSAELLAVHAFVGQVIFYGAFVIMILVPGRYNLKYPEIIILRPEATEWPTSALCVALLIGAVAYMYTGMIYSSATPLSPLSLSQSSNVSFTYPSLADLFGKVSVPGNYTTKAFVETGNRSAAVYVYNITRYSSQPLTIIFGSPNATLQSNISAGSSAYLIENAKNVGRLYEIGSPNTSFIYYSEVPYLQNGSYNEISMYVVLPYYPYWQSQQCIGTASSAYDDFTNLIFINLPNSTSAGQMQSAYCLISRVVIT